MGGHLRLYSDEDREADREYTRPCRLAYDALKDFRKSDQATASRPGMSGSISLKGGDLNSFKYEIKVPQSLYGRLVLDGEGMENLIELLTELLEKTPDVDEMKRQYLSARIKEQNSRVEKEQRELERLQCSADLRG